MTKGKRNLPAWRLMLLAAATAAATAPVAAEPGGGTPPVEEIAATDDRGAFIAQIGATNRASIEQDGSAPYARIAPKRDDNRSEESRVGNECVSTFRYRLSPYSSKKQKSNIL